MTAGWGYWGHHYFPNVLLLSLLLYLASRNTLTTIIALLFLFCSAMYAPVGMTYGKINSSFIVALLQTNRNEAAEFIGLIPWYHLLMSVGILIFMPFFWWNHKKGYRQWIALLFFILCSVNSWPLRMIKSASGDVVEVIQEMQHYAQLKPGADNWKIISKKPNYRTIVIVVGESVRRDYMSVYGYPLPTTSWLNNAPGLFIDGYTSAAPHTVSSLSRSLIANYEQEPKSGNTAIALAKRAGYSTWWVSNQGSLGRNDSPISAIASEAEHTIFLKKGGFASLEIDDDVLLRETEQALADTSSKVIFIHMMGSHPNPCDRLHSWPNPYRGHFPDKVSCYLASIGKLDDFLRRLDAQLRKTDKNFAMLYFSDHGLSVNSSGYPIHHDGNIQEGYKVPLIIMASDISSHQIVSKSISARHFIGILEWLMGIHTENESSFNPWTDSDRKPVTVFNEQKNVFVNNLSSQAPILPDMTK
ncbi:phosphoethanolamine transferase [Escherichia coli]|uniref:phosphoethanolamine transferase n=1 Tax=Escherichia coli TaxID=562 RepID=UPI00287BA829|nr:phosphoethanolamine transferase [Escherichia coli]